MRTGGRKGSTIAASIAFVLALILAAFLWTEWRAANTPGGAGGVFGYDQLERRFEAHRAEFEDVRRALPAAPSDAERPFDDDWLDVDVPARIGDICIDRASHVPRGGVVMWDCYGSGLVDDAGFAYLPAGPWPELETGWFEAPEYHDLGDGWYSFTASW